MNRGATRGGGGRRRGGPLLLALVAAPCLACGVKGPPQPPLVRVPVAPTDLTAVRRGDRVDLRFLVPAENADGSRPANIERVDVYALTGPADVSDQLLLKRGMRIASVPVKAPRDPDETIPPGDPISDVEPPQGPGLDQGAVAEAHEILTAAALQPVDLSPPASSTDAPGALPLMGPVGIPSRIFVSVGVSTRGRRGAMSKRAVVTTASAPAPVARPEVTYDETTITVKWKPVGDAASPARDAQVLPSTPFAIGTPTIAYHVYEVMSAAAAAGASVKEPRETASESRLTQNPVADATFVDKRLSWTVERCYTVRVVQTLGGLPVESDAAPVSCVTPVDTFPPAVPTGLTTIPAEGAITLIWNPNSESDLAGYLVLRAEAPNGPLVPVTPVPVQLTTFRDTVAPGARFGYAVRAIDKAGNASPETARVEETAR